MIMRAIIIDDEEKGRKLLRNLLGDYCKDVEVVAMAESVRAGVSAVHELRPDLIFLDVVMPNQDGFDLVNQIGDEHPEIIFTTAYNEYAIRAIRACALDYLLKPIDVEELQTAVEKARSKLAVKGTDIPRDVRLSTLIENMREGNKRPQKIGFPTAHGVVFYQIKDISVCKAEGNYTTVYFQNREKIELVSKTLKEFEEFLADYNFIRTHRSYLINLSHLKEYRRGGPNNDTDGEGGCVVIANSPRVPVSRDKRKALLERISKPF